MVRVVVVVAVVLKKGGTLIWLVLNLELFINHMTAKMRAGVKMREEMRIFCRFIQTGPHFLRAFLEVAFAHQTGP